MDIRKQLDKAMSKPAADEKWFAEKYPETVKAANMKTSTENKPSKKARIWNWLKAGNSITPMLAKEMFGCMSLAQRVCEWRKAGHNIQSRTIVTSDGARPSEYWLEA